MEIPHEIEDAIRTVEQVMYHYRYLSNKPAVADRLNALKAEIEQIRAMSESEVGSVCKK